MESRNEGLLDKLICDSMIKEQKSDRKERLKMKGKSVDKFVKKLSKQKLYKPHINRSEERRRSIEIKRSSNSPLHPLNQNKS